MLSCSCRFRLIGLFWMEKNLYSGNHNCVLVCDCGLYTLIFSAIKELPYIYILMFSTKRNSWNMFHGGVWNTNMNAL